MKLDLVGLAELHLMLGVSRQRVDQLARTKGFPEPVAVISAGRIWLRQDVEKWAKSVGRTIH
jgi:prophage regulatory protein